MALFLYDYIDDPTKLENYDKQFHIDELLKRQNYTQLVSVFGEEGRSILRDEYEKLHTVKVSIEKDFFDGGESVMLNLGNVNAANLVASVLDIPFEEREKKFVEMLKNADIDTKLSSLLDSNEVYNITVPEYAYGLMKKHGMKLVKLEKSLQKKYNELSSHEMTMKINDGEKSMDSHVSDLKRIIVYMHKVSDLNA